MQLPIREHKSDQSDNIRPYPAQDGHSNAFRKIFTFVQETPIRKIMQQEDDLRGLAKVMQFMRALSLLFSLIHFYWYAYSWITAVGWNTPLVDKILMNFQRTSGLFTSPLYTKLFSLLFLVL